MFSEGQRAAAIDAMRKAADLDDASEKTRQTSNPSRIWDNIATMPIEWD